MTTESKTAAGYVEISSLALQNRRLLVTEKGRIGLGPCQVQPGDTIAALFGGYSSFFLRPSGEFYQLVGLGTVYGLMDDALDAVRTGRAEQRIFDLI
ncbi:hypothetical protein M8818_001480 [Zalaria obscura]|uniref:Uncharacterized protein n=1 Tax=Zalaria obscura TaxID=2024903 RepID=A0ACC3SJW5_9PEZI